MVCSLRNHVQWAPGRRPLYCAPLLLFLEIILLSVGLIAPILAHTGRAGSYPVAAYQGFPYREWATHNGSSCVSAANVVDDPRRSRADTSRIDKTTPHNRRGCFMRNALIVGLAVVCAAIILSTGGLDAQSENAATMSVNVAGVVDVGNFPETQKITGTFALLEPPKRHFVGITMAIFPPFDFANRPSELAINRVCFEEFPETVVCTREEIVNTMPPPAPWPGRVIIVSRSSMGALFFCIDSDGFDEGFGVCTIESPATCCGF